MKLLDERHVVRASNGYRIYSKDAVQRVMLIKMGQKIGFSLRHMAVELNDWDNGLDIQTKKEALKSRLKVIDEQIVELGTIKRLIETEIQKNCLKT